MPSGLSRSCQSNRRMRLTRPSCGYDLRGPSAPSRLATGSQSPLRDLMGIRPDFVFQMTRFAAERWFSQSGPIDAAAIGNKCSCSKKDEEHSEVNREAQLQLSSLLWGLWHCSKYWIVGGTPCSRPVEQQNTPEVVDRKLQAASSTRSQWFIQANLKPDRYLPTDECSRIQVIRPLFEKLIEKAICHCKLGTRHNEGPCWMHGRHSQMKELSRFNYVSLHMKIGLKVRYCTIS